MEDCPDPAATVDHIQPPAVATKRVSAQDRVIPSGPEQGAPAAEGRSGALTRVCSVRDWGDPELTWLMDEITPSGSAPVHRKAWEFAIGVSALERGGVLHDEAVGLSVGAGHEPVLFYLTNRCRWLFATDIYGMGIFGLGEAAASMLIDPDLYAPYPYRRRRLTVTHMDALDLRFENGTFDFVVSFGSIEHFGGAAQAAQAMAEISRVLKPGGIASVTTEVAVDGRGDAHAPGLEIFSPETVLSLGQQAAGLEWFGGVDLAIADDPDVPIIDLSSEMDRLEAGDQTYPHLRLRIETLGGGWRTFSSVSLALKRDGATG